MSPFRRFREINDLHTVTGYHEKTANPLFHVFNTKVLAEGFNRSMPPYQQDFYQVGLNLDLTGTSFTLQSESINSLNNLLFFVAPGQVITWEVSENTDGFLLYFKKEFFSFFRGELEIEFPFFKVTHANFVRLSNETSLELYEDLSRMRKVFEVNERFQVQQLQGLTFTFLYRCKGLFESYQKQLSASSRKEHLYYSYINLIDRFFRDYRSVEEYAALLNVTPSYLSSVVKAVAGRTSKSLLDERVLSESKNLLAYSNLSVAEIAYSLNFSEPTHFIRFFKKEVGRTPADFRQIKG